MKVMKGCGTSKHQLYSGCATKKLGAQPIINRGQKYPKLSKQLNISFIEELVNFLSFQEKKLNSIPMPTGLTPSAAGLTVVCGCGLLAAADPAKT